MDHEALMSQRVDQRCDAAAAVLGQILGERVAELDATKRARVVHVVTIPRGTDIRGFAQRRASAMSPGKRGET